MLKNWSGQAQDHEFFLFAHSIMNFFLSPTASSAERCPLAGRYLRAHFRRVRYSGSCRKRELPCRNLDAETNLPRKE